MNTGGPIQPIFLPRKIKTIAAIGNRHCGRWRPVVAFVAAVFTAIVSTATASEHNRLTDRELAAGWILLFDGETDYGWKASSEADWKVRHGTISVGSGAQGLFYTTTQFADYVLKVDFRYAAGTNSGVFLRTPPTPTNPQTDCYELNIAPAENPFPTGSLVARQKTASAISPGEWHTFEVKLEGDKIHIKCDGQHVLQYVDPKPLGRGHIGLQINQGQVEFRNIKLKPLGLRPIFNGRDLTGWNTDQKQKAQARVLKDATLHLEGGPGAIESQGRYGDFVLQLECFSKGAGLDSGLRFRCVPGQLETGYESQIHNGHQPSDPSKPSNCGTGGFVGRQDARRLAASDFTWFSKTLVCHDNHMAVWVNGIQVSDWKDERAAHENPRHGQRLQAGTLVLEAPDSASNFLFRTIRIVDFPAR